MKLLDYLRNRKDDVPEARGDMDVQERYYTFSDTFKSDPGWFQKATDLTSSADVSANTAVYACVNILSQEVASLWINHWRVQPDGSRVLVEGSNATRVLRRPNAYQTASDFWLYLMRNLLLSGGGFAVADRNKRDEITTLHPLPSPSCHPMVAGQYNDVYFQIGDFGDNLFDVDKVQPARNVFNPRINCFRHPLIGETPITSFTYAGATGNSIQRSIARFFGNMARPSGVLTTPKPLTVKQLDELKTRWAAATKGDFAGGTPVLHSGLKWEQITMAATDAEIIASYQLSISDIAMAYRVPLFLLGDLSKATFRNVETLMRLFYTSSLRFYLEHLENNLNVLFELDPAKEYLEFDVEAGMLRGDFEQRMNALSKGVQGGILTPNEARKREELPPVKGGNTAFLQRQMVPIAAIQELLDAEAKKADAAAEAALNPPEPPPAEEPDEEEDADADKEDADKEDADKESAEDREYFIGYGTALKAIREGLANVQ